MSDQPKSARTHLAWLIWCIGEGYTNAEDRAILDNWLLLDPATLSRDDVELRPHLLAMADEVLEAMRSDSPQNGHSLPR